MKLPKVRIYVLTGVTRLERFIRFRAYETKAEADEAKAEYVGWLKDVLYAFEAKKIFSTYEDICAKRKHWFMQCPWGMRALSVGFEPDDIYVDDFGYILQESADLEIYVLNATARASEIQLLASLLI